MTNLSGGIAETAAGLLRGSYDLHVHTAPDVHGARLQNDIEYATSGRAVGMAGAVLKSHHAMTADRAWIARWQVPGFDLFGSLCLDAHVGGITPSAVEMALRFVPGMPLCRIIWMPTIHAKDYGAVRHPSEPGYRVVDERGRLTPETIAVIELVKEGGAALATGHLPLAEQVPLLKEARRRGLERLIVTHVDMSALAIDIATQKELSEMAYLEHCVYQTLPTSPEGFSFAEIAARIRAVGASRCFMSTDLGQAYNPPAVDGLRFFIVGLLREGITEAEIAQMVSVNPAALLGVELGGQP